MKRLLALLLPVAAIAAVLAAIRPAGLQEAALPSHEADLSNGQRLVHAGGCVSCHVSAESGTGLPLLGGGLEMETPFGLFRVPNISPHPDTGIGGWSKLDFVNAMHAGVSPSGEHYYPAFPYASYTRMTLEDLVDLKAWLDTLPAVDKPSLEHQLNFPWNLRFGIGFWKLRNLKQGFVVPVDKHDEQLLLGRYLVEGPGHCGECHTPRDWTGGMDTNHWLAGGASPEGEGRVPNITPHPKGLADWSAGDIGYYLESGLTPDFDTVGGSMVEVQKNMAQLSVEERAAIAAYLKAVPPSE
jgi:mono/diheme cytochrome c family protein